MTKKVSMIAIKNFPFVDENGTKRIVKGDIFDADLKTSKMLEKMARAVYNIAEQDLG